MLLAENSNEQISTKQIITENTFILEPEGYGTVSHLQVQGLQHEHCRRSSEIYAVPHEILDRPKGLT